MEIEFWEGPQGFCPVGEFIEEKLNPAQQDWLSKKLDYYGKYEFQKALQSKHAKEFEEIKPKYGFSLYELRPLPYRFLFVFILPDGIAKLLHPIHKKTDKTDSNDIARAMERAISLKNEGYLLK